MASRLSCRGSPAKRQQNQAVADVPAILRAVHGLRLSQIGMPSTGPTIAPQEKDFKAHVASHLGGAAGGCFNRGDAAVAAMLTERVGMGRKHPGRQGPPI